MKADYITFYDYKIQLMAREFLKCSSILSPNYVRQSAEILYNRYLLSGWKSNKSLMKV